jgi:hypothetical protein
MPESIKNNWINYSIIEGRFLAQSGLITGFSILKQMLNDICDLSQVA